ncbi:hypothetical protein ONS95_008171 [Cadophora gregata]|uniref:uncharacterized protein n=1 Tax=Cadophora gregata TaxID=51156 RepID=UPI0026DCBF70|nr:uncharacterized protein ONS95_008171 [Cadophora gregata]KAK0119329.1 hypothetical protein ONS96_012382 [Cadophora gregata f. sp. sojae]KAK0126583.1 hypothetical protein ONS95_008171 [Cadophora gregata]
MFSTFLSKPALLAAVMLLLAVEVVNATPTPDGISVVKRASNIPEHYEIVPLVITGSIDGVAINHTGTVQEVFAQLDAEDNNFKLSELGAHDVAEVHSRDTSYITDVNCIPVNGQNWNRANQGAIREGIAYLRRGSMACWINPHSCSRISCSWDSAIYLCNNNNYRFGHPCFQIADYAQAILDKCQYKKNLWADKEVGGQAWDILNWNVPVYKEHC